MRSRSKRQTCLQQAGGRVSSGRRTNVKLQPPDWTEDEGPASTPSYQPALPAKGLITPLQQHSLVGDRGRANHPPVGPVQQGPRTQGFYGRKPWKKPNSEASIAASRPAKEGLQHPFRRLPPNRSQNLTANPSHSRPGYRHRSPTLSLFRNSRFLIALRVS